MSVRVTAFGIGATITFVFGADRSSKYQNPVTKKFNPFPYQIDGAQWLATRKTALLADEMGLGKTAQVIMAADQINASRILVICPAIGRVNWEREFRDKSPRPRLIQVATGSKAAWLPDHSVVTSYEGAGSVVDTGGPFDLVVIDEGHYLKDPKSKRTRAILGKSGLVRQTSRIWILTGTPAPNHYGELWPILYTFGLTKLSYDNFVERYCITRPTDYGTKIMGSKRQMASELKLLLGTAMLRRLKSQVLKELPPLFYSTMYIEPSEVKIPSGTGALYDFVDAKTLEAKLEAEQKIVAAILANQLDADSLATLEAISNSVSTLRRYTGLQKVYAFSELIQKELEANAYKKIVIFGVHRQVLEGVAERLREFEPNILYGGLGFEEQQKSIDRFQNDPKARVIIANIRSAGTSVTLTAAQNVAFIEPDWVPANNAQAVMRCHRIGQMESVFVRFFSLNNSIDNRVTEVLERKTKELSEIFESPN